MKVSWVLTCGCGACRDPKFGDLLLGCWGLQVQELDALQSLMLRTIKKRKVRGLPILVSVTLDLLGNM